MADMQLRRLGPEPWGARLTRARETAGLTVRQVEEILFPHISRSALVRLENFEDLPPGRKDRGRAALVLTLYGFELEEFELGPDNVPPAMDIKVLHGMRRAATSTEWWMSPGARSRAAA